MAKTAIITGAAQNIGKGIAKGFLETGYSCILLDNNESALKQTVEELSAHGRCQEYALDIADLESIGNFINWLGKQNIDVKVLVNNVGYESEEMIQFLSVDEIKASFDVNLAGPFYLTSRLSKLMNSESSIVFITSTHSSITRMHPLYSSSKAAIEMFMKEAALELAAKNIRVNAVAPGPVIDTPELQGNKYVPLGYSQQPRDIAEAVKFLLSDSARFITGQTLTVDGGFSVAHTHYWKNQDKL
jgi:3-oxoacyl-[acyl-carrier protein] reductase